MKIKKGRNKRGKIERNDKEKRIIKAWKIIKGMKRSK